MNIAKILLLGDDILTVSWTKPATMYAVSLGDSQINNLNDSLYSSVIKQSTVALVDMTFEFHDSTGTQTGPLTWVTYESSTGDITVTPTW